MIILHNHITNLTSFQNLNSMLVNNHTLNSLFHHTSPRLLCTSNLLQKEKKKTTSIHIYTFQFVEITQKSTKHRKCWMSSSLCNTHLLAQIKCSAETRLQVERSFHFLLISIVTMWEGEFEPWTSVGNTHLLATRLLAERSFHLINIKKQSILQLQPKFIPV